MPGKRPRQIQRTTSMSQLGGGGMALGAPHRGLSAPAKQGLLETMEVCTGVDDAVVPGAFMEDTFSSMAIDDSVEESSYASHAVRPGVSNQANYPWVQHQSLHAGYSQQVSPNKAMAPQAGVYRGHETGRSAQPAHFLDVCYLCSKRLGHGRDVFIYRGDRAFCSVECRHAQIVADEKRENCGMAAAKEGGQALNAPACNPPNTKQVETAVAG